LTRDIIESERKKGSFTRRDPVALETSNVERFIEMSEEKSEPKAKRK